MIVIDSKHTKLAKYVRRCARQGGHTAVLRQLKINPEDGPAAVYASHPDRAPHQFDQLFRYRKPQSRSFVAPGARRVGLLELLKDMVNLILGDTDAGIFNLNMQRNPTPGAFTLHIDKHMPILGELDSIADQV